MSRFFVPKEAVKGKRIYITGDEAHHIINVMRLKVPDKVVTFDGTGKEYSGFIRKTGRKYVEVEIVETRMPLTRSGAGITLIQAIPKKEKMDYIVEKATELGAHSVIPVITKRTIPDWNDTKKSVNAARWRRIAAEAAKQCGRRDIPLVGEVSRFSSVIKETSDYDLCLIAALDDQAVRLKDALAGFKGGSLAIAVGPEGDFAPDEIKAARGARFKLVSLGSRVLKSDTAGLAMLAILNYEFSD